MLVGMLKTNKESRRQHLRYSRKSQSIVRKRKVEKTARQQASQFEINGCDKIHYRIPKTLDEFLRGSDSYYEIVVHVSQIHS